MQHSATRKRIRAVLLTVLFTLVLTFAALLLLSLRSPLRPEERAALLTTREVAALVAPGERLPRVNETVERRRSRSGGVEVRYDGLSRGALRVTSIVLLEPDEKTAAQTFTHRAGDLLDAVGFTEPVWTTSPCAGALELGDEGSCVLLAENGATAGALVVVRAKDRILSTLIVGAWFDGAAEARELLGPHVAAMGRLTLLGVLE